MHWTKLSVRRPTIFILYLLRPDNNRVMDLELSDAFPGEAFLLFYLHIYGSLLMIGIAKMFLSEQCY